jgi:hypothetical protein
MGRKILLVEDETVTAMDLSRTHGSAMKLPAVVSSGRKRSTSQRSAPGPGHMDITLPAHRHTGC